MASPFVFSNDGIYRVNNQIFGVGSFIGTGYRFGLFVNDYTPTVFSDVTAYLEPTMTLYSRWAAPVPSPLAGGGGVSAAPWPAHTYLFGANIAAQTVYGWFVELNTGGFFWYLGAARLTTPYLIPPGGGSLPLTFTWTSQKLP